MPANTPAPIRIPIPGSKNWAYLDTLKTGQPVLVIEDEKKTVVAKVYMSPDDRILRIFMPELSEAPQVRIDEEHHIVDIQRHYLTEAETPAQQKALDRAEAEQPAL